MGRSPDELQKIWLSALKHERRASPNTLRAYGDDVARFLAFQREHLGGNVTEHALSKLRPADIRAFIATRRGEGLGAGGVQRALAAIRGFYKFLAREGILENAAPRAVRTPRLKRGLPRPLSPIDAQRAIDEAGEHDVEWLGARDAALLTLLYGAGLRISEALSLKRGDVPLADTLTILGKGRKERVVPVLPLLREAIGDVYGLDPARIVVSGDGSDAILTMLANGYLRPGDEWESRLMLMQGEGEETIWDAKLFYHGEVAVSAKLTLAKVKNPQSSALS